MRCLFLTAPVHPVFLIAVKACRVAGLFYTAIVAAIPGIYS